MLVLRGWRRELAYHWLCQAVLRCAFFRVPASFARSFFRLLCSVTRSTGYGRNLAHKMSRTFLPVDVSIAAATVGRRKRGHVRRRAASVPLATPVRNNQSGAWLLAVAPAVLTQCPRSRSVRLAVRN